MWVFGRIKQDVKSEVPIPMLAHSRLSKAKLSLPSPLSHQDKEDLICNKTSEGCTTNSIEQSLRYEWATVFPSKHDVQAWHNPTPL